MVKMIDKNRLFFEEQMTFDIRRNSDVMLSFLSGLSECPHVSHKNELSYQNYKNLKLSLFDMYKIVSTHYVSEDDKRFLYEFDKKEQQISLL